MSGSWRINHVDTNVHVSVWVDGAHVMKASRLITTALINVMALTGMSWADGFNYPNFGDTTGLTLNAIAHVTTPDFSPVARLVSTGQIYGGGSIFYNEAQNISQFETRFCFHITELGGITDSLNPDSGADGLAFVVQPYGPTFIEHTGGGMGYEGALNSVAIEFDCWDNGPNYTEPSRSHVGVMIDGVIDHAYAAATANVGDLSPGGIPEIDSNVFWWTTITYQAGLLSVSMAYNPPFGGSYEVLTNVPINIPAVVGTSDAWVGLTAGTGLAYANHDICNWSFIPEPASLVLLVSGGASVVCRRM